MLRREEYALGKDGKTLSAIWGKLMWKESND
jgi:hypothetical protein